jgi:aconitate hydratase
MRQFNQEKQLTLKDNRIFTIHDINALEEQGIAPVGRLPFSIRVLLENLLRNYDKYNGKIVSETDVLNLANWKPIYHENVEIPFFPYRVVLQDFTGVPAVVDLAAMRDAMKEMGKDPGLINPAIPVDLVIDHSVQVDFNGTARAYEQNLHLEHQRNRERYCLLKWAQESFDNFRVFPPGAGIIHQVNLEYLSRVVVAEEGADTTAFPDTLIGTDSHTPMINGIGVLGWGVGGIEAESVMLGQPMYIKIPEVIGVKLLGRLPAGATATDLVLTVTQALRKENVVEKFVEFFGPGMKELPVTDRATIANMAPEYGATMGFFPVDEKTLDYLALTGRGHLVELVETYSRALGLFYTGAENPEYTKVMEIDLGAIQPSLAGPSRPQDRVLLKDIKPSFENALPLLAPDSTEKNKEVIVNLDGETCVLSHSSVVIAAITSCTNTSNPRVMLGAGLLAKKAVEKGLRVKKYVKTSFAPGSRAVTGYINKAGLMPYLDTLGFNIIAYGCTTCIGNSGPLHPEIEKAIRDHKLAAVSVLSGNRNFEARIHQLVKANYLASPLLVVAFALAGRIDFDMDSEPLGTGKDGAPVFLKDIWPSPTEIDRLIDTSVTPDIFREEYRHILKGDEQWMGLPAAKGKTFAWDENSTYIRRAPFFENFNRKAPGPSDIENARALLALGDSVTTDHISPAGEISAEYPAGQYLLSKGAAQVDFNSYGSRRGNHEVMIRGTFANPRIKNKLVTPKKGGYTVTLPGKEEKFIYDAAQEYMRKGIPLVILGGKEYGSGSSRDWAAKGTLLLGVRAVIAQSYERIHRGNLIGMGVLPLQFEKDTGMESLGLTGSEIFSIAGIDSISPAKRLTVTAVAGDGKTTKFTAAARLDTKIEVEYYKNSGILAYVLREMIK